MHVARTTRSHRKSFRTPCPSHTPFKTGLQSLWQAAATCFEVVLGEALSRSRMPPKLCDRGPDSLTTEGWPCWPPTIGSTNASLAVLKEATSQWSVHPGAREQGTFHGAERGCPHHPHARPGSDLLGARDSSLLPKGFWGLTFNLKMCPQVNPLVSRLPAAGRETDADNYRTEHRQVHVDRRMGTREDVRGDVRGVWSLPLLLIVFP